MTSDIRRLTKQMVEEHKGNISTFDASDLHKNDIQSIERMQALYRLSNLEKYWISLQESVKSGDVPKGKLNYQVCSRLIDAFLLGSASERISGKYCFIDFLPIFIIHGKNTFISGVTHLS